MANNFYRLKHKLTGLYYTRGSLSEKGKIYTTPSNYKTYLGKYDDTLTIAYGSKIYKKYEDIFMKLVSLNKAEIKYFMNKPWYLDIYVVSEDFEKEFL